MTKSMTKIVIAMLVSVKLVEKNHEQVGTATLLIIAVTLL